MFNIEHILSKTLYLNWLSIIKKYTQYQTKTHKSFETWMKVSRHWLLSVLLQTSSAWQVYKQSRVGRSTNRVGFGKDRVMIDLELGDFRGKYWMAARVCPVTSPCGGFKLWDLCFRFLSFLGFFCITNFHRRLFYLVFFFPPFCLLLLLLLI